MSYCLLHEKELIPYRPDRCPMATDCALGPRTKAWRAPRKVLAPRDRKCDPLGDSQRLYMARIAPRFPPVSHRLPLLPPLAEGWNVGVNSRQVARTCSATSWAQTETFRRGARQPKCEDDRARWLTWLRRREKRWWDASDTSWSTRWDCCGRWSSRRLACKTATGDAWYWKRSVVL